jgi:tetratricopeptide (TPR) repeat protein
LRRGQLPAALGQLSAAIGESSNQSNSEVHRLLALAYWADDQFDKSIDQYNAAIRLNPDDERSRIGLADVLIAAHRSMDAERALKDTLLAIPDSGQAHERLGQLYQGLSLHPEAVAEFEKAARFNPIAGQDHLYETIGALYANQADFDATVGAYLKRIEVNPNNGEAHRKLGEIYSLQGRYEAALAEFTASVLLNPKDVEAHAASSQVYLRLGRYGDAVEASRSALALAPGHSKSRYVLATSLMRLGQTTEGMKELELFRRAETESTTDTQRRAEIDAVKLEASRKLANGEYAAAVALFQKAALSEPNLASVHLDLGRALIEAGQHGAAVQHLSTALRLEDSADGHRYLAEAFNALGRADEGRIQDALYRQLAERSKEERLRKMTGLR